MTLSSPRHAAEISRIPRPPDGCEEVPVMLSRLLYEHEQVIIATRDGIGRTAKVGDDGTSDMLVGDILRPHELQVWSLAEHLVDTPLVRA